MGKMTDTRKQKAEKAGILAGITSDQIARLQRILNNSAWLIFRKKRSEHVWKMTDTRKQKAEKASEMSFKHCSRGTCRSDSRFPQLVV